MFIGTTILPAEHNPVTEAYALIEQFSAEGQSTADHPLFQDTFWLFNSLRAEKDLRGMLRAARGNYYALEAVLRAWLFVTVPEYGAEDAAEIFTGHLNEIYAHRWTYAA